MFVETGLQRFIEAQKTAYFEAFAEVRQGRKQSHWMWYIFPQIKGLGSSETSKYFAIKNKAEAIDYLNHPILGKRIIDISSILLNHPDKSALEIFGNPDHMKLRSCMTLFGSLPTADQVFQKVLDQFFKGVKDPATLKLMQ